MTRNSFTPASRAAITRDRSGVLVTLLRDEAGATVEAMSAATGWQAHSVRGAIAGALKKRLGFTVTSEKTGRDASTDSGRGRRVKGEVDKAARSSAEARAVDRLERPARWARPVLLFG